MLTRYDSWIFLGAGGVAAAVLLMAQSKPPAETVSASNATPAPSPKVSLFAEAIARAEGFFSAGTIPARANNPGDLKAGAPTVTGTAITQYATPEQGWAALYRQLGFIANGTSKYYGAGAGKPNMTIREMGDIWAPPVDRNIPGAWAVNVANRLGVSVDTPIRTVLA